MLYLGYNKFNDLIITDYTKIRVLDKEKDKLKFYDKYSTLNDKVIDFENLEDCIPYIIYLEQKDKEHV